MKRKSATDAQLATRTAQAVELVDGIMADVNTMTASYASIRMSLQTALTGLKEASTALISKV